MKFRIYYFYIVIALIITGVSSCRKTLQQDPKTTFGTDYVFSNISSTYKALIATYSVLAGDYGYGCRLSMYYPLDDDEIMGPTGSDDGSRRSIARYSVTAGNSELASPWNNLYKGIERANNCIYYIPQMSLYSNGTSTEIAELHRMYGEALTLRALFYFDLIKNWGDVPAQWVPSSQVSDLFLAKTNRDSIYDHILSDLALAEQLVPVRSKVSSLGDAQDERITQEAVRALRARIALFCGGYSLRSDGKMERRTDYLSFYKIAYNECDTIIDSGSCSLDPSFKDLWKNNVCNVSKTPWDNYGELILQVAMSGGSSSSGDSKLGYYNGTTVNSKRGKGIYIVPTYFYSFDRNDSRRDVTCAPYSVNSDGSTKTGLAATSIADGKYRSDWIYPVVDPSSSAQYFGLNWILIRYSDVLLMFAEADNEINGAPSAKAISAYETVRKRAFNGNASLIGTTPTAHDAFFTAIVNERGWEFADEGIRKYDLIRWNLLGTYIANTKAALTELSLFSSPYDNLAANMYYYTTSTADDSTIWANSYYGTSPSTAPSGTKKIVFLSATNLNPTSSGLSYMQRYAEFFTAGKNELLPIPQTAIDADYNLTQNPGY